MKNLFIYLLFSTILIYFSCSKEETKNTAEPENTSPSPITSTTPCLYEDLEVKANTIVSIDCLVNLEGKTIEIPENVTLEFDGGDIFNGTLNFTSRGKIAGKLLNSDLTLTGNISLIEETFEFITSRWDIVEGLVSDEIATNNRDHLETLFLKIKNLETSTFVIDKLDAYFKIDGALIDGTPSKHGINIPSDFNLKMSSNTHLRMQPHGHFRASLLSIYNESNITISGGFLHGDREEHDYNSGYVDSDGATGPTHEWVDTMRIKGGQDIIIDGVTFMEPAGDCIQIAGIYHFFQPEHIKSTNITIKNCEFYRARRTNIVITSGDYIYIENNKIEDGGINMNNSLGTAPSSNLNIEPVRGSDAEGNTIEYQRVNNVYIKNNTQIVNDKEENPSAGSFQISHADGPIIIEDNIMTNTGVGFFTANGVEIKNNTITNGGISAGAAENIGREDIVYGNIISGNTVVTENIAINVVGNGSIITGNNFEGATGVSFGSGAKESTQGASNIVFNDNKIKATNRGISTMNTMQNVLIENNEIHMLSSATFAVVLTNEWDDNSNEADFIFTGNTITGEKTGNDRGAPPNLINSNSITIDNNTFGELQFSGGENMNITNNVLEAEIGHNGILINGEITNTIFDTNVITIYPSQTPLSIECVSIKDGITIPDSTTFTNQNCTEK